MPKPIHNSSFLSFNFLSHPISFLCPLSRLLLLMVHYKNSFFITMPLSCPRPKLLPLGPPKSLTFTGSYMPTHTRSYCPTLSQNYMPSPEVTAPWSIKITHLHPKLLPHPPPKLRTQCLIRPLFSSINTYTHCVKFIVLKHSD
jgi:hypothetical protein